MSQSTNSPPSTQSEYDIDPETGAVLIPLGGKKYPGRFALVDPDDVGLVAGLKWCPSLVYSGTTHDNLYAMTKVNGSTVYMHRMILGIKDRRVLADHINHHGLDNRRCNLRSVTSSNNNMNKRKAAGKASRYKGVTWYKRDQKWMAYIHFNDRKHHLGYFDNEIDAAMAYDGAALTLFGSYAHLNFREGEDADV